MAPGLLRNFHHLVRPSCYRDFSVNSATGALTPLPGSPWAVSDTAMGVGPVEVTPDGTQLCFSWSSIGKLTPGHLDCARRRSDGTLDLSNRSSLMHSTSGIFSFAITPTSAFVLAADTGNQIVISPLTATSDSSNKVVATGGTGPAGIAVSPSGSWVAVANSQSSTITVFSLDAAGNLTQVGSGTNVSGGVTEVAFSRSGNYLFASTANGTAIFAFGSNGSLTAISTGQAGGAGAITSF
jgi:6-phosphogluconolactonase (cycloisomerase 2 family)